MTHAQNRRTAWLVGLGVGGVLLLLAGPAAAPPPGGGGGGGGGGVDCSLFPADKDVDRDGFTDREECLGLGTGAAFSFPGCETTASAAPNCLHRTLPDVFVLLDKATGSAFDEAFGGLGPIPPGQEFAFAEAAQSAGGLGIHVHVLPENTSFLTSRPRGVTARQSAIRVTENRTERFPRDSAGTLVCISDPPPLGIAQLGNANEFGSAEVFSQLIFDRVDCVGGLTAAQKNEKKRTHLLNTLNHELGHVLRLAPDPNGHHYATTSGCIMALAVETCSKGSCPAGVLPIPTVYCTNDRSVVTAGTTSVGPTVCGDVTTFDGDGLESCLPKQ